MNPKDAVPAPEHGSDRRGRKTVTAKERLATTMSRGVADRVPVMCQLSLGHYFLQSGIDRVEIWHDSDAFAAALVELRRRYGFDGILVNLPGRDPGWRRYVRRREDRDGQTRVTWRNGLITVVPGDDNPHVFDSTGRRRSHVQLEDLDPDHLYYVEPHDIAPIAYPQRWGFAAEPAPPGPEFFPAWQFDTIRAVRSQAADVSVHGEVFSPFSQMMELLGYENALLALLDDPGRMTACLERLSEGTITLALGALSAGADAILMSSAFAGAGLISRSHYAQFVLPHERRVVAGIKAVAEVPIYVHTCGAIGDRLDLVTESGVDGIDTLDPPPLGTVDLADAKRRTSGRVFLKGNLDPVNELLNGSVTSVLGAAKARISAAAPGGGYVLSSACSVSPRTPPENLLVLREAVERYGRYD